MPTEPLTEPQRTALLAVLRRFAPPVARVDLFGSRARGAHRPGSDIDLVVDGQIDDVVLGQLRQALDDSDLSVPVDLIRYRDLPGSALESIVHREARPLFASFDLHDG